MAQIGGVGGWIADRLIRRSVRKTFRNVYWVPPTLPISEPAIFVANHHGWHDGYLMYLALSQLGLRNRFHDWIQEYDAFPLFGKIGGMPYPANAPNERAVTLRKTIRLLRDERHSLILFAEGILHPPPGLMSFGKALDLLAQKVPAAQVIPVAIRYEFNVHERPEAFLLFGGSVTPGSDMSRRTRLAVWSLLDRLAGIRVVDHDQMAVLAAGTPDVNERMDMRNMPPWLRSAMAGRPERRERRGAGERGDRLR